MAGFEEISCAWCGKAFMPYHWKQRFCCEDCRTESRKEAVKKANEKYYKSLNKPEYKKKCLVCKKSFKTMRPDVVTCSPYCQAERTKERRRKRARMLKETAKKMANQPKPVSIEEFNRRAREMGMTYGQYELYLRLHGKEQKNVI